MVSNVEGVSYHEGQRHTPLSLGSKVGCDDVQDTTWLRSAQEKSVDGARVGEESISR